MGIELRIYNLRVREFNLVLGLMNLSLRFIQKNVQRWVIRVAIRIFKDSWISEVVVCSLERTHDSDPTPAIVSPRATPTKSESLVLRGVVMESSGVIQRHPESSGFIQKRLEPFTVVRNRLESFGVVGSRFRNDRRFTHHYFEASDSDSNHWITECTSLLHITVAFFWPVTAVLSNFF